MLFEYNVDGGQIFTLLFLKEYFLSFFPIRKPQLTAFKIHVYTSVGRFAQNNFKIKCIINNNVIEVFTCQVILNRDGISGTEIHVFNLNDRVEYIRNHDFCR